MLSRARWPGVGQLLRFSFVAGQARSGRASARRRRPNGHPLLIISFRPAETGNSASWVVRLRRTMLTRRGLLLAALLSQGSALLTGIAARRGTVNVQANLVGTARLFLSDIALKVQQQLDPDLELY